MDMKGPILVVTSISLLVSVALIRESWKGDPVPDRVTTTAEQYDPCRQHDFGTIFGKTTCDKIGRKDEAWQRRASAGGAVFISVGNN